MPAYKDEKRGTWYCRFRYTDWSGRRIETTKRGFATKKAAKEYEAEAIRTAGKSPDMTMRSLCELYLDDLRTRRKPTTVYSEECMIRRHILPHLGELPINQITVATVRQWQNTVMQSKAIFSGRPLSPHTLRNISVCLSSLLNYAVRFHGLPRNPVQIARGMGKTRAHLDFWELSEYEKFLSVIVDPDERLPFEILFLSGMRLGEMLALTPADVDFKTDRIHITKTYNWKLKYVSPPKTETSVRTISMPHAVMSSLEKYLASLYEPPARIFEHHTQKTLTTRLKKYAALAGVHRIRLHDLRHSHASFLIHSGVPITAISRRLGHKSPKVTLEVYSHMYSSSDADIAKILETCGHNAATG